MTRPAGLVLLAALALLAVPGPAGAVEQTGTGEAMRHVLNVPHSELRDPKQTQQATDFELAKITVPGTGAERTFAFAGSYYDGLDVIDVTDPAAAHKVASYDCGIGQGDVQVFRRGDRWLLAYAQDDGYKMWVSRCTKEAQALGFSPSSAAGGTYIFDVTDPLQPQLVSFVSVGAGTNALGFGLGSHNTTIHPGGRYLYNSNADLMTDALPSIEIIDLEDLAQPKVVGEFALKVVPGLGTDAHDITFSPDGSRAYVAALSHGEILDTTDPLHPRFVSQVVDPALNVWHQMEELTVEDPLLGTRSFLLAEDEFAGAEGTGECPSGGVHVYDISDEAHPVKVGAFNIDEAGPAPGTVPASQYVARCTAHVFKIDPVSKVMTMGWYNAGVRILDLSALAGVGVGKQGVGGIRQLGWFAFKDSDTWAAKAVSADRKGFYVFANDKRRGFDVYRYDPVGGSAVRGGTWLTPAQALADARQRRRNAGSRGLAGVCFLAARA
jgi:hypothetical protein